ncbi:MAG: MoaD/ThiS family protein [Muribaculaceae bacterium]|nr:MoaD/ThiS family protein [Muribaculaceae bacterium]
MRVYIDNREYLVDSDTVFLNEAILRYTKRDDGVAAFLNRRIVPRSEWEKTMITDGDEINVIFARS